MTKSQSRLSPPPLPEKIALADLEPLNQTIATLFNQLRIARNLPPGEAHGRSGATVALSAVWQFLMQFEPVLAERLHVPLMNLHSALLALNQNNVEPILRPTKRTGRARSSPRRNALIGIAVGAAQRLEWTGLSAADVNKAVAAKLAALGIKPTRGNGVVTADTLRRWREQIGTAQPLLRSLPEGVETPLSDWDLSWIEAAVNAESMTTDKWRTRITALAPADARRFVLQALENSISQMILADPAKPPS